MGFYEFFGNPWECVGWIYVFSNPPMRSASLSFLLTISMWIPGLSGAEALGPEAQQALAAEIGAKAQRFEMWTDEEGHVMGLIFINHGVLTKEVGEKPGIDNADLERFTAFPRLKAVNFEMQAIGDEGLAVLSEFPGLVQIGYHYMGKHPKSTATPACVRFIDGKPGLEILEIKHNFKMDALDVETITTRMPKVWRLVLDTPLTAEQTMHLVRLCPNVRDLQLHRTRVSAEQLAEIGRLLPKLEVLWFKPSGGLKAEHLAALNGFENLRIFSPQAFKAQITYKNGWDALTKLPALERVETRIRDDQNGESLRQLLAARPGLIIEGKLTRSRNFEGL